MQIESLLYSDIKIKLIEFRDSNKMPKTLIFAGGSAYMKNVCFTVFDILIPRIDNLLNKKISKCEKSEMVRTKKKLVQILFALGDDMNHDIDLKVWNEQHEFSSHKLNNN